MRGRYCVAEGRPADAAVVYGDTDSLMIDFRLPPVAGGSGAEDVLAEAERLGREAAAAVTAAMPAPIRLEFEKAAAPAPPPQPPCLFRFPDQGSCNRRRVAGKAG